MSMNTLVSYPIAKLLKEKGFDKHGYLQDVWLGNKYEWKGKGKNKKSVEIPVFGLGSSSVLPTISDVVMWLYEKHGIWIYCYSVAPYISEDEDYPKIVFVSKVQKIKEFDRFINTNNGLAINHYYTPTEAYEAAIEYTLKNLI